MGTSTSKLEQEISADHHLSNEHFYGLVNFGNTCYCNSVIQALYFCRPFREKVLAYKQQLKKSGQTKDNLLTCLADLFHNISTQKRRMGTIAPKKFITKLKKENELFDNYMQQDAHEFLNYLLNTIADIMEEERNSEQTGVAAQRHGGTAGTSAGGGQQSAKLSQVVGAFKSPRVAAANVLGSQGSAVGAECNRHAAVSPDGISLQAPSEGGAQDGGCSSSGSEPTWVHDIFQGTLTNETRCLNCESVSSKDEDFLDLSLEVETNASITHCLRVFSNMETLCNEHKYYCEYCCSKQEAQKRMRVKRLPKILALHLKRFKYQEQVSRYTKLSYRVLFPMELRLFNMADDATNADRMYDLVAVVVHCGATPNRGHYITVVKSHSFWLLFDDDMVDKIEPFAIEEFFGLSDAGVQKNSESAYILFYQARDCTAAVTTGSGGAAAQSQHAAAAQSHAAAAQSHGNVNGLPPEAPAAAAGQPHATKLNA